jgi:hypothetical protein
MSDILSKDEIDALLSDLFEKEEDECDERDAGRLDYNRAVCEGGFMYIPDLDGNVFRTKEPMQISLSGCPSRVIKKFIKGRQGIL